MARLNDESQELYLGHMEFKLFGFDIKVIIEEAPKKLSDVLNMLIDGIWKKKQNIIQVDEYKLIEHVSENIIYQSLENCGSVGEAEGHD